MPKSPLDSSSSFSFSRRHFHFQWRAGKGGGGGGGGDKKYYGEAGDEEDVEEILAFSTTVSSSSSSSSFHCDEDAGVPPKLEATPAPVRAPVVSRKKKSVAAAAAAVSRVRTALATALVGRHRPMGLGPRVTGTLFGNRRGRVQFAFQVDPRACPALLLELATPTSVLVREMACGLVRIALECERGRGGAVGPGRRPLLEEPLWRAYCNGKKCGYAVRRECGPTDWKVLRAVEPVSTGAGVLPDSCSADGDVMYMRAKFERVVGSKDSEAFYMMNPDGSGGPELSIYLLRA